MKSLVQVVKAGLTEPRYHPGPKDPEFSRLVVTQPRSYEGQPSHWKGPRRVKCKCELWDYC